MDKTQGTSLVAACKDFFGFLPGQGLGQFSEEYKKLSEKDKVEIREGLIKNGYNIHPLEASAVKK